MARTELSIPQLEDRSTTRTFLYESVERVNQPINSITMKLWGSKHVKDRYDFRSLFARAEKPKSLQSTAVSSSSVPEGFVGPSNPNRSARPAAILSLTTGGERFS